VTVDPAPREPVEPGDRPIGVTADVHRLAAEKGGPHRKPMAPDANDKIAFDRLHVAKHIGDAVNKVRVDEHAELKALGDPLLTGTRYLWLQNPENMKPQNRLRFEELRDTTLRVARAWAMKEAARHLWSYEVRGWVRRGWTNLIDWMARSRLGPMVKVTHVLTCRRPEPEPEPEPEPVREPAPDPVPVPEPEPVAGLAFGPGRAISDIVSSMVTTMHPGSRRLQPNCGSWPPHTRREFPRRGPRLMKKRV
jgi:hypothetical protein